MSFAIGNITIKNNIVLAPMAGISNPAYIKICEEMGAGYAITELISSEAIIRHNQKTLAMLQGLEQITIPVAVQIFGANPDVMASSAQILVRDYHVRLIDINMGCPVPKVAIRSQAGSALLKNPQKIYELVKKVVNAVDVPVTVKIRSGWDAFSLNAIEVAKAIEKAGAAALTIHARTRAQGYSGRADWSIIKQVKEAISIPVIGNGDVTSCYLAKKMLDETHCDAVMIGRGALGNPWLIRECVQYIATGEEPQPVTIEGRINMLKHHFSLLLATKPEKLALLEIRSNALWYIKGLPNSAQIKSQICSSKTAEELFGILDKYLLFLEK